MEVPGQTAGAYLDGDDFAVDEAKPQPPVGTVRERTERVGRDNNDRCNGDDDPDDSVANGPGDPGSDEVTLAPP